MAKVYPVIMSGGIGSRLWPLSRRARPKQFAPLFDGQSLFQATVERVRTIQGFEDLIIVTGRDHARFVAQQLDALKVNAQIVLEPAGRESAPAIAAAAALIAQKDQNAVAVVVASDHLIPDHDHFRRDCNRAVEIAETDRIVTLGIKPSHPSDAYGYIQPQQPDKPVSPVAKFVEKPNEVTAQTYLEQGFLWNSGNFIAKASTLVTAFAQLAPDVLGPVEAAVQAARITADGMLLGDAFVDAQKISMDYAIMEKTDQASVLRSTFEWSDLGAWDSLYAAADKDSQDNAFTGDVLAFDSERCAVRSKDGTLTVLLGVADINVVVDEDVVLVSAHSAAQRTKDVVAALQRDGRPEIEGASTDSALEELSGWFQTWLATAALPLWATAGFDYDLGIWRENLDQTGRPTNAPVRARVQGRQNTVFAIAGRQGWPGPWPGPWQDLLSRARLGAEQHFNLATGDHTGLMRGEIFADGQPSDAPPTLYDHTFQLLAEVHGAPTGCETRPCCQRENGDTVAAAFSGRLGGLIAKHCVEDGFGTDGLLCEVSAPKRLANPTMHALEVLLARLDQGGPAGTVSAARDTAVIIADFALTRFVCPEDGWLFEVFDDRWNPIKEGNGARLEPGHHFEWSWLLAGLYLHTRDHRYLTAARRLYDRGLFGLCPQTGAAVQFMDTNGKRLIQTARLWSQAEWLKAALRLAELSDDTQDHETFLEQATRAANILKSYLETPVQGLWFDKLSPEGGFIDEPAPASSLYHLQSAIRCLQHHVSGKNKAENRFV